MNTALYEYLVSEVSEKGVLLGEPMKKHTTFRVGGDAKYFVKPTEKESIGRLIKYFHQVDREYFVLGNGSNLLVGDKGYKGVVLDLSQEFSNIKVQGERIIAQAGALLSTIAIQAMEAGLSGLEFASGIPGTIGGAVVMNAGAYDGEMSQIVKSVTVVNKEGEELILDNDTMEFSYRNSIIKNTAFVIVEVELELQKGDTEAIKSKMNELNAKRREKQPLEYPSAGSTFKRPEGHFAGKLIMDAGLRGHRVGGASVSEKHCGFVINDGTATAADIAELIDEIIICVKETFHVTLEPEVIKIGDF